MNFVTYEIKEGEHYLFSIGSRIKPDSLLREAIERTINEAMEEVKHIDTGSRRTPPDPDKYNTRWSCQITHEPGGQETGSGEIEPLKFDTNYLIFGLIQSGETGDRLSEEELEELRVSTAEKIDMIREPEDMGKIALVILQDGTVTRQIFPGYNRIYISESSFYG